MTNIKENTSRIRLPLCDRSSGLESLFSMMLSIRLFEQSILNLFEKNIISGTTHTCLGQESTAVGVVSACDREKDIVFSNHRAHGHYLAYCGEIESLYLELMGKPGGVCAGRGGSQHLNYRNFYSNGVQGGIVPIATGMALAEKIKKTEAIVIVFLGDGTLGQGVVYESFNIASLWGLPILYVIDDNGYAQSTPATLQVAGSMKARPESFGIPVEEHTVKDVREVLSLSTRNIEAVRKDCHPHCLLLHTFRLGPHSKGDDTREPSEVQAGWDRDPLSRLHDELGNSEEKLIQKNMEKTISQVIERALEARAYESR